ncbi:uncharacterized protein PAC_15624 [Phialocephala subalpina]|uniref:Uncharacterized protein n=1 Tax=Phialocephala subalpina TaxID=576137 RepID=A0A1L7XL38_9HELO|nr:uncharacterized protein PAC_15624 [Phialocephala subalpina]
MSSAIHRSSYREPKSYSNQISVYDFVWAASTGKYTTERYSGITLTLHKIDTEVPASQAIREGQLETSYQAIWIDENQSHSATFSCITLDERTYSNFNFATANDKL